MKPHGKELEDLLERLIVASFGKGDSGAKIIAALMASIDRRANLARPFLLPIGDARRLYLARTGEARLQLRQAIERLEKLLKNLVYSAAKNAQVGFLDELGQAREEQRRSPEGRNALLAKLLLKTIAGEQVSVRALRKAGVNLDERQLRRLRNAAGQLPGKSGHPRGQARR
jgi:hypothetical protein